MTASSSRTPLAFVSSSKATTVASARRSRNGTRTRAPMPIRALNDAGMAQSNSRRIVRSIIRRESRFDPRKIGSAGERGLMQVSERAAREWARETQAANFHADDLLDPKTNLEAGAWYLHRAFQHWEHQKKPVVFALAEYNAGASRAQRWANNDTTALMSEQAFRNNIDFPGTRNYVASVLQRYEFYRKRGR